MIRSLAVLVLFVTLATYAFGSDQTPTFELSAKLKDRFNPDFSVCTLIRINEPIEIEWSSGSLKSRISAQLGAPKGETYPLSYFEEEATRAGPSTRSMRFYR